MKQNPISRELVGMKPSFVEVAPPTSEYCRLLGILMSHHFDTDYNMRHPVEETHGYVRFWPPFLGRAQAKLNQRTSNFLLRHKASDFIVEALQNKPERVPSQECSEHA